MLQCICLAKKVDRSLGPVAPDHLDVLNAGRGATLEISGADIDATLSQNASESVRLKHARVLSVKGSQSTHETLSMTDTNGDGDLIGRGDKLWDPKTQASDISQNICVKDMDVSLSSKLEPIKTKPKRGLAQLINSSSDEDDPSSYLY